jgi:hypothetical protein
MKPTQAETFAGKVAPITATHAINTTVAGIFKNLSMYTSGEPVGFKTVHEILAAIVYPNARG